MCLRSARAKLNITPPQGFAAINRFISFEEPIRFGNTEITQKTLYTGLFAIGLPILWFAGALTIAPCGRRGADQPRAAPLSTFFWLVGASSVLILGHAAFVEPGVESEYGPVESV